MKDFPDLSLVRGLRETLTALKLPATSARPAAGAGKKRSFRAAARLCPGRQVRQGGRAVPTPAAEPRPARLARPARPHGWGGASAAAPARRGPHKGPAAGRVGAAPPAPGPALPSRFAVCSPGRGRRPPRPAPWPPRLLLLLLRLRPLPSLQHPPPSPPSPLPVPPQNQSRGRQANPAPHDTACARTRADGGAVYGGSVSACCSRLSAVHTWLCRRRVVASAAAAFPTTRMKRPKLKKASKRMTCHKRYKIQKKVREHHRKLRKEAKKQGRKKPRKDPGVPNSAPFKEALLREAELRKQRLEELKQQQKLDRQKEQEKKRKLETNPGVKASNLEPVNEEFGQRKAKNKAKAGKQNPKKLYCQELKKVIEASDVVLEVLDARDPLGCRCPQVEEAIVQGGQKKLVLVLNKSDLVPKENLENWLNYLKKELPTVVFRASTNLKDKGKIIKHLKLKKRAPFKNEVCVGKEGLWKLLRSFQETYSKAIRVGVIGFPNVGKSSIINSLKQERICNVGVSMGLTRCMQVVTLDKQITVIDSPSCIVSPLNSASTLALRSPASIEMVKPVEAASAILSQADARQVVLKFTVPDFKNPLEFFTLLAQRRGLHQKGGSPNVEGAAKLMWSEWTGASLGYYCHPPTSWTPSPHFNEGIMTDMKQGFNLEELEKNNAHSIHSIRGPRSARSILFQSSGLTNGIIEEKDIPEELPRQKEKQQEEGEDHNDLDSDQESVDEEADEESLAMVPAEETWALPEEFQADESAQSYISDKMTEEEDDAYDFSTDYV